MITSPKVINFAIRLLRVVPVGPARALASLLGMGASYILAARRRTVLRSLVYLRPDLTPWGRRRMATRTFANLASASVDLFRLPTASRAELGRLVAFEGLEELDKALERGNGAVVVTPHLGPYELGGACLAAKGYRTYAVAEDLEPAAYKALATIRQATGMHLINQKRAATRTRAALKENAVVLLVADRVIGRTPGIDVPFGTGTRPVPVGPAALAAGAGAPIIVAHIHRTPHAASRYAVCFDPPLVAGSDGAGRDAVTLRMAERLSQIVVEHADEWYVFQPEWRQTDGR